MRKLDVRHTSRLLLATSAALALFAACGTGNESASAAPRDSGSTSARRGMLESHAAAAPSAATATSDMPAQDDATGPTVAMSPALLDGQKRATRLAGGGPAVDAEVLTASAPLSAADPTGAMLIRQGQASIEVTRLDDAVTKVRQTAAQFGGFVANTSLHSGRDEQRAGTLEVRVPTAQFDGLLAALGGLGKVESVSASAQDVGDEYVDLGARAANARRLEARLIEMLATRTGKLSDVLTVEQELTRVREQIERYEARLKWLEKRSSLSTLAIALHEPLPLIERQPGPGPVALAFAEAWARAIGVLAWCIASLGVLVPVAGLIALALLLARRLLRGATPPGVSGA